MVDPRVALVVELRHGDARRLIRGDGVVVGSLCLPGAV